MAEQSVRPEKQKPLYPKEGPCAARSCGAQAEYLAVGAKVETGPKTGRLYGKPEFWLYCAQHATEAALSDTPPRSIEPLPETVKRAKEAKAQQERWNW